MSWYLTVVGGEEEGDTPHRFYYRSRHDTARNGKTYDRVDADTLESKVANRTEWGRGGGREGEKGEIRLQLLDAFADLAVVARDSSTVMTQ